MFKKAEMYFGETDEEKYESIKAVNKFAKKIGKIFVLPIGVPIGVMLFSYCLAMGVAGIIIGIVLVVPLAYFAGTFMGKGYAWGWLWYKSTHNTNNLVGDMTNIAAKNLSVSYFIGGRGTANASIIGMLVVIGGVVLTGFWKGVACMEKYQKLEKILGKKLGKI